MATIRAFQPTQEADLSGVVRLWNRAAASAYGFSPFTPERFRKRVLNSPRFAPERLLLATTHGSIVGMAHTDSLQSIGMSPAGVVEALLVDPEYRRQGIGRALLEAALLTLTSDPVVDGGGAWPYSPFYATCIDGSERSGIFASDFASLATYAAAGFRRARESLVMACALESAPALARPAPLPQGSHLEVTPRLREMTWLDHVFRGWDLRNHILLGKGGDLLSRAIFGRMTALSELRGEPTDALFGVNTPDHQRRRGLAETNLSHLLAESRRLGARRIELHVYADNLPAIRLYEKLGFHEVARTVALRRGAT